MTPTPGVPGGTAGNGSSHPRLVDSVEYDDVNTVPPLAYLSPSTGDLAASHRLYAGGAVAVLRGQYRLPSCRAWRSVPNERTAIDNGCMTTAPRGPAIVTAAEQQGLSVVSEPWSVARRQKERFRLMVLRERIARAVREDESRCGSSSSELRVALDEHAHTWAELDEVEAQLEGNSDYPDGDSSCRVHDDPVFGERNPPDPSTLLYHYTRARALAPIGRGRCLRFRPLAAMNDPQEALFTTGFQTGLLGRPGEDLVLTAAEAAVFNATDWTSAINQTRRSVKVGAFSTDVAPDVSDVDPEHPELSVPRRIAALRGFAHPRMWAQYGDDGRGACLVFDLAVLRDDVRRFTEARGITWAYGDVVYQSVGVEQNLGFFDARRLVHDGVGATLLANFADSFLAKHPDWAHEQEFRFLVADGTSESLDVPISNDAVVGLVLGPAFNPRQHLRYVRTFARRFGVEGGVRALHWTCGRAELAPVGPL